MSVVLKEQDYQKLTRILIKRRKELGLTQVEVAKKLNITQSTLSRIETNESQIDILLLGKLAKLYQLKIENLV